MIDRIYEVYPDSEYLNIFNKYDEDSEAFFHAVRQQYNWPQERIARFERVPEYDTVPWAPAHIAHIGALPILCLKQSALDALHDLLTDCRIRKSAFVFQEPYWVVFPPKRIAVNIEGSTYTTFKNGSINHFLTLDIAPDAIGDLDVFVLDRLQGFCLCSQHFRDRVEANNLIGFQFRLLWSAAARVDIVQRRFGFEETKREKIVRRMRKYREACAALGWPPQDRVLGARRSKRLA